MPDQIPSMQEMYPSVFGTGGPVPQQNQNYPSVFQTPQQPLAIDGPETQVPLPIARPNDIPAASPNIEERAPKAAMGITDKTGITEDQIKQDMTSGKEAQTREQAAKTIDSARATEILQQPTVTTDPIQIAKMFQLQSPETVFEQHFAQQYVDHINWPKQPDKNAQDTPFYKFITGEPDQWDYLTKNGGHSMSALREYARTIRDYAKPATGVETTANLIFDFASAGLYSEARLRQGDNFLGDGLGLGSNLDAQATQLYTRAIDDFPGARKQMWDTYSRLAKTDPIMAYKWISSIAGQGENERFINNIFTLLNVAGPIASIPKAGRTAIFDMIRSPSTVVRPNIAAAAAAGNVPEAALRGAINDVASSIRGDQDFNQALRDRLGTLYDLQKRQVASDPGTASREMKNRIMDQIDADKEAFINNVMNLMRVQKTPASVQLEAQVRGVQGEIADRNRGIDNQVINVSDPIFIDALNLYRYDVHIGTHDADFFRSLDELRANAERNGLVEKGAVIKTADLNNEKNLNGLVESYKMQAALARTPEGKAAAEANMELIRQQLAKIPRHETGYTIGGGPLSSRIGTPSIDDALRIQPQGNGYYIIKSVFLNPEEDFVRDGLITTSLNTVKDFRAAKASGLPSTSIPLFNNWRSGWVNGFLGRFRDPSERLSMMENANRMVATHGPGVLLGVGEKTGKPLKFVPKRDWEPFNRMLKANQKAFNEGERVPGIWFDTPSQVINWFNEYAKFAPHDNTVDAYFAYKNMILHDLNLRDMIVGQRKLERGFNLHNIRYKAVDGTAAETGFFEGVRLYDLPKDWRYLMVVGQNKETSKTMRSKFYKPEYRTTVQEDIKAGKAKLIQIADPKSRPMKELDGRRIEYVLAYGNRNQEKPIAPLGHVNRRGGGHLLPEWDWYIKQAHVDDKVYEGDKTMINFMLRAQAQEALPHLENVRKAFQDYKRSVQDAPAIERLMNEGGREGGPDYLQRAIDANRVTGIPFDKHFNWYFGRNKFLDLDEPFHVVPRDTKIIDMPGYSKALRDRHRGYDDEGNPIELVDGTRGQGSLLGKTLTELTGERDAEGIWTMANKGTQQNPLFAYEPAPYIDPITAAERSYGRISRTMFLSDMQDYSREHWLQQAIEADALNATPAEIRENPYQHFFDPQYKDGFKKQRELYWQLESNRKQALDFTGIPNEIQQGIQGIAQGLADSIYKRFGANKFTMVALKNLPKLKDPTAVIRNWTFNSVLGLYSLPSMFTQISTFGNVLAISPRQAPAAAIASMLYGISKVNRQPGMLEHLDNLATQLRMPGFTSWKPGQFKEFVQLMEKSGFHRAGSHAFSSNLGDKVIKKGAMSFLDWGRLPFNLGAGFTKIGGYATAYLEHRLENQFGSISRQNEANILARAGLLDHNMSSAFNTKMQQGLWGIAFQFQAYETKIATMMTGKNLTPAEKGRMFLFSTLLYGAGVGGLGTLGFSVGNYINNQVQMGMAGQTPGNNPVSDLVFSGVPSVIGKYLTGFGDYANGTLYDFGRWGNKGIDWIQQIFEHDGPNLSTIMSGVAGNVLGNSLANSYGIRQWAKSVATQDGSHPIQWDDVLDNFNEISIVRNTRRLWHALAEGRWLSQNGGYVMDISKAEAVMQYIFGLSPTAGSRLWQTEQMIKENAELESFHEKKVFQYLSRSIDARNNNDMDNFRAYMRKVETELQVYIPLEKRDAAFRKAMEQLSVSQSSRAYYELLFKQMNRPDIYQQTVK